MPRIERFEDLIAWRKARDLAVAVYRMTSGAGFQSDFSLRNQMRRCAVSVCANIAEGFDRSGLKEFHQFLSIAKGSCAEFRSHLHIAKEVGHLSADEFSLLYDAAEEVSRVIAGLRRSVDRRRNTSKPTK